MSRAENTSWKNLFCAGGLPPEASLLGPGLASEWRVDVRTGLVPSMGGWPLRHRKRLAAYRGRVNLIGENVLRRDIRWGFFVTEDLQLGCFVTESPAWGSALSEIDHRPSMLLNYDLPANGWFVRQIRDHVRTTSDPNVLIGRMYFRGHFLGYFTMTRGERDA